MKSWITNTVGIFFIFNVRNNSNEDFAERKTEKVARKIRKLKGHFSMRFSYRLGINGCHGLHNIILLIRQLNL